MSAFPSIIDMGCSYCNAPAGEQCTTPTRKAQVPHADRYERYQLWIRWHFFIVQFKDDDPKFGINAGDEFVAQSYHLDPQKVTLLYRLGDGWNPECNAYWHQAEFVRWES